MALSIRELAAARLQKASKTGGGNIDYSKIKFKPEIGKDYQVRILPNKYSPDYPIQELEIHQYDTFGKSVVALSSYGEKDPIVKYADDLWKEVNKAKKMGDPLFEELEKEAKTLSYKLKPKKRFFAQVIVRGEESKGALIWEFGTSVATVIDSLLVKEDFSDLWDVETGTDLEVTGIEATMKNNKTGKVTTYPSVAVTPRRKSTVLDKDEELVEKWLEDQKDPATIVYKSATYDELKEMLRKFVAPEDEEEDDDIKPPVRKPLPMAPAKAPVKRVVEEYEEEEAPKPTKKPKAPVVEEEEEEIPEPPKKKKAQVETPEDLPWEKPKTKKKLVVEEEPEEEEDELSEVIPKVKGKAPVVKPAPAKKSTAAPKFNSALFDDDDDEEVED